jgi:hypothetical protein
MARWQAAGPQLPVLSNSTQLELLVPLGGPWPGPQAAKPPRGLESAKTYSSWVLVPFWGHDERFLEIPEVSRSTLRNHLKGGLTFTFSFIFILYYILYYIYIYMKHIYLFISIQGI